MKRLSEATELKVTVTEVARRCTRGRGVGVEAGRSVHAVLWGDPIAAVEHEEYATPLPLAWYMRRYSAWLYGIADMVVFRRGTPVTVYEVKSYPGVHLGERVQVRFMESWWRRTSACGLD